MKRMIGGKLDSGVMQAQSKRTVPILFCNTCGDFRKFRNGKCKKCGNRKEIPDGF